MENLKNGGFSKIWIIAITALIVIVVGVGIFVWQKAEQRGEAIEGARDSSIKADMRRLASRSTMIYLNEGTYINIHCEGDLQIREICERIKGYTPDGAIVSYATTRAFCVQAPLNEPGAGYWCIDSEDFSGEITAPICTVLNVRCR